MRATIWSAAFLVCAAVSGWAADTDSPGAAMYLRYCGACHGPKAEGDGVAATVLQPKPANLTTIARRHDGTFPSAAITAFIDGTKPLPAHGSSEMPVWGEILREEPGGSGSNAVIQSKLILITEYLRSLQKP